MNEASKQVISDYQNLWRIDRAMSPVIATAIHDGHGLDRSISSCIALNAADRLREEDPFTGQIISRVPNRITCNVSRFCIDLNRAIDVAVYLRPEDAWDLTVWNRDLSDKEIDALKLMHEDYYRVLDAILKGLEKRHGKFVVLDVHSYNHRRSGPTGKPTTQEAAPDINIGTFSMDRARWSVIVDTLISHFSSHAINGRYLDVRENVAFKGRGEQTRYVHQHFPLTGCAVAIEYKKFFMDEWTGEADDDCVNQLSEMLGSAVPALERALEAMP